MTYAWSGVLRPVNADGSSVFRAGSTVSVKLALTGASPPVAAAGRDDRGGPTASAPPEAVVPHRPSPTSRPQPGPARHDRVPARHGTARHGTAGEATGECPRPAPAAS